MPEGPGGQRRVTICRYLIANEGLLFVLYVLTYAYPVEINRPITRTTILCPNPWRHDIARIGHWCSVRTDSSSVSAYAVDVPAEGFSIPDVSMSVPGIGSPGA